MANEKTQLPLARKSSDQGRYIPDSSTVEACMNLCTNSEVAKYFLERFESVLQDGKVLNDPAVKKMFEAVQSFVNDVINAESSSGETWSGKEPSTTLRDFQQRVTSSIAKLSGGTQIILNFAINDLAQFLREYLSNGQPLDTKTARAMDESFNLWLAEHKSVSKDGVIYQAENGKIKKDKNGKPKIIDAEKMAALIVDAVHGFEKFVQKINSAVRVSPKQQPFPERKTAKEGVTPSQSQIPG